MDVVVVVVSVVAVVSRWSCVGVGSGGGCGGGDDDDDGGSGGAGGGAGPARWNTNSPAAWCHSPWRGDKILFTL